MRKPIQAALELFVLATVAWVVSIHIQDDPSHSLNVPYFGLKWIFYTYLMATSVHVITPISVVVAIAMLVALLRRRRPENPWAIYRSATWVAAVWMVLSLYGLWYGGTH